MKKRIFAMLLALTMIIGILPMSVFAEARDWASVMWNYSTMNDVAGKFAGNETFSASTTFYPGKGELRMMPILSNVLINGRYYDLNAMAYFGVTAVSNNTDVVEVKTKDGHVDAVIGKWQGGDFNGGDCLQLNVTAKEEGTAVVTVNFWYTFSQSRNPYTNPNAKWFYGTMNYTVKVVDSESSKPAKPTKEDLKRFRNYVNTTSSSLGAVYMWCDTHDHQAWFNYLTDVDGAYTIGEVEPNDDLVSTIPASTYPWICKITLNATAYLDEYNRQMGAQYGTHYLKDGQAETVVVRAYYNPSHETWYFLRSDAPVYIDIIHTSNVPDAPTEDDLFNNGGQMVHVDCVAPDGHSLDFYKTLIKGTVSIGTPYKNNDGDYACDVTIDNITPYIEEYDKACNFAVGTHRLADKMEEPVVATAIYSDGHWAFLSAVKCDVTCEVEVPEITDDELADALNRATVLVECTTNDAHVLHEYLASIGLPKNFKLGELVRFNDMPAYEIELTTSAFIDKYSEDEGRHKAGENTPETLTWYVYHRDEGWAATALDDRSKIVDVVDPDAANVHFMVYKSNDLSKAVADKKYDGDLVEGDTLDLTTIDISDIYTGSEFIVEGGWYNDYLFNLYKDYAAGERDSKPTDMTELEITGKWQNVILVITDMNKVVYFNTAEDLAEYQQNHDADLVLYSTKAPNGSALPTTDAPTPKREGYTFDYWCREGQTVNVEGQTIGGWTNLYAHWTINEYTVTFDSNGGSAVDAQTVEYGQKASKPVDPTKEGWRFIGWYDGEEEFDFDTAITENITLTAHWQKLDPTADEIKAALGNVTVKCINPYAEGTTLNCTDCVWPAFVGMTSEGFTYEEDADNEGTYVVTIPVENFVTSYTKRAGAKHDLFSADTMTWLVTWDNENSVWTSQPAEDGVDNVITVTHAPTYWKEVGKIATGKGIKTECVNGNTGVRVFGLTTAFVYPDQIVSVELTAKGTYTATFKLDKYASSMTGSNGTCPEHDREHYVISDETVTWNFIVTEEDGAYTWTAEPVEEGNDDICEVAHDWIVTFDADNGTEPQTQNVRYEGKAKKPADPTKEGNWKFVAWYLGEEVYDFDTVVTGDITLTAHWEETVAPYKVEHYCEQTDGTYTLKETETLEGEIGTKVTAVAKTYPHYVEDTENAERVASGVVIKKSEGELTLKLYYKLDNHTVTFDSNGGTAVETATVKHGQKVTKPADPTKEGNWKFVAWYLGEEVYDFDTVIIDDITLTAHWEETVAPYKVEHYCEQTDGTYTLKETETLEGEIGTKVTAVAKTYPHYVEDTENAERVASGVVIKKSEGELTLKLYYKLDNHTVTFDSNGGTAVETATVKHGQKVTKPADPTKEGNWKFVAWYLGEEVYDFDTVIIDDITLTAHWEETVAPYKVEHYCEQTDGTYTLKETETLEGEIGTKVTAVAKTYPHYVEDTENAERVASGVVIKKSEGELTLKLYYKLDNHTVTFDSNGGTAVETATVKHGQKVTKPADPTKEGNWKFVAWYLGENEFDFDTVITDDITLTAHWEETVAPYKVEHYCEQTDGTYTLKETETLEGEIGTKVTAVAKTYPHYVEDTENAERVASGVVIKKSEGELTLKLYYKLDNHTVTFDSNGGTAVETATVKHGQKVTKPADPTKEGNWKFVAWYLGENEFDFDTVITDDITLTAHWNKTPSVVEPKAAAYRVEHYCEQTDGTYTLRETETLVGELKSTVTAVAKDYAHYSENTKHSGRIPSGVVVMPEVKDGEVVVLTLKLYYDLDRVTLSYDLNGGIFFKAHQYDDQTVRYGTKLTAEEAPFRSGFKFVGWNDGAKLYQAGDTIVMTADTTLKAVWSYKNNTNPIPPIVPSKPSTKPTETPVKDNSDKEPSGAIEEEEVTYPTKNDAALLDSENHIAYVNGYNDGTVRPEAKITRAEAATMFYRLLNEDVKAEYETDENEFSDVSEADWYCTAVSTLANIGIFGGYPDGSFRPDAYITRAEFAAICARIDGEDADETAEYSDIDGHWAADEISRVAELGWVKGYTDGTFRPNQQITRAEAMAVINRITERNPETKADLLDSMKTWVDNTEDKWYYIDVQEATVAHDYERKDNGREAWTD